MTVSRFAAVAGATAVAAGLMVAPAHAADDSFDGAARAMLQKADISPSLGSPGGYTFTAQRGTKSRPWLCSTNKGSLQGKKAKRVYEAQYELDKNPASQIAQTIYVYASESASQDAWKDLTSKVKKCDSEVPASGGAPQMTTTFGKTAREYEGSKGRWVYSTIGSKKSGESSLVVFFRNGNAIQTVEYDVPMRAKQANADSGLAVVPGVPLLKVVALAIVLLIDWAAHVVE